MQYATVQADSLPELEARVNTLLRDSWEPQGGVCATEIEKHVDTETMKELVYTQALVRGE